MKSPKSQARPQTPSREDYRLLFAAHPSPMWVFDEETLKFLAVNAAAEKLYGWMSQEFLAMTVLEVWPESEREKARQIIQQNSGVREARLGPYQHRTKQGALLLMEVTASSIIFRGRAARLCLLKDVSVEQRLRGDLQTALRKYANLFNNTTDGVWIHNLHGHIVEVNDAYCRMSGYAREELLGTPIAKLEAKETGVEVAAHIQQVLRQSGHDRFESLHRRKDGLVWDVEITVLFFDEEGGRFIVFVHDITERKAAETALRESEAKAQALIKYAPTAIYEIAFDGSHFVSVNDVVCEWTGYTREELMTMNPLTITDEAGRQGLQERIVRKLSGDDTVVPLELKVYSRDGRQRDVMLTAGVFRYKDGVPESVQVIAHDITARKQTEEAIQRLNAELEQRVRERTAQLEHYQHDLQALAARLVLTEERERKRLAMALHDSIGQMVALMRIKLAALEQRIRRHSAAPEAAALKRLAEDTLQQVRTLTHELSPPILYQAGLAAALQDLGDQLHREEGLAFHFEGEQCPDKLDETVRILLYQSACELLANVRKHAQARHVQLSFARLDHTLRMTVQDDGVGFESAAVERRMQQNKSFGLFSIRERMLHMGGSLTVESAPGRGTRVTLTVPLAGEPG